MSDQASAAWTMEEAQAVLDAIVWYVDTYGEHPDYREFVAAAERAADKIGSAIGDPTRGGG